ncbi:MAG: aspartate kinase, partial [Staphylococcus simulans]
MKVAKFGGSSVASASQIQKVLNIINSDDERKIIVVSAPGKRHSEDIKT